jgi:hypothetical protein
MSGDPVGHGRGRPGYVDVRAAAVVRHDLRDGPGLGEQRIDHRDRGGDAARLARGDDGVQPGPVGTQHRHVPGPGATAEAVAAPERGHVGDVAQPFAVAGPAGVDQLSRGGECLEQVSTKTFLTADKLLS